MNTATRIIMWIIWLSLVSVLPMYRIFLSTGSDRIDTFQNVSFLAVALYVFPLGLTIFLRWYLIPKIKNLLIAFIPFFIGSQVAVSLSFYGLFLFEEFLSVFFITSCLATLQFMPVFNKSNANKATERDAE